MTNLNDSSFVASKQNLDYNYSHQSNSQLDHHRKNIDQNNVNLNGNRVQDLDVSAGVVVAEWNHFRV